MNLILILCNNWAQIWHSSFMLMELPSLPQNEIKLSSTFWKKMISFSNCFLRFKSQWCATFQQSLMMLSCCLYLTLELIKWKDIMIFSIYHSWWSLCSCLLNPGFVSGQLQILQVSFSFMKQSYQQYEIIINNSQCYFPPKLLEKGKLILIKTTLPCFLLYGLSSCSK